MQRTRMTRDESRAQTVQRVVAAAQRLFESRGFTKVSVAEIAESAGYSTGAVYANFPNKEALFIEVRRQSRSREDSALAEAVRAARTPADLLNGIGRWHAELLRANPAQILVTGEFWLMQGRNPLLREKVGQAYEGAAQDFAMLIIGQLERLGAAPPEDPEEAAKLIMALRSGVESQSWFSPDGVDGRAFPRGVALLLGLDPGLVSLDGSEKAGEIIASGTPTWNYSMPESDRWESVALTSSSSDSLK